MFVHAVAASELARDMILAPNVGPLQQTKQQKSYLTLKSQQIRKKPLKQLEVVSKPVMLNQTYPGLCMAIQQHMCQVKCLEEEYLPS